MNILSDLEDLYRPQCYESLLGDDKSRVHLYVGRQWGLKRSQISMPIEVVTKALETPNTELSHTSNYYNETFINYGVLAKDGSDSYYKSLATLAAAQEIFNKLPNAEVDLRSYVSMSQPKQSGRKTSRHTLP